MGLFGGLNSKLRPIWIWPRLTFFDSLCTFGLDSMVDSQPGSSDLALGHLALWYVKAYGELHAWTTHGITWRKNILRNLEDLGFEPRSCRRLESLLCHWDALLHSLVIYKTNIIYTNKSICQQTKKKRELFEPANQRKTRSRPCPQACNKVTCGFESAAKSIGHS